MRQSVKTSNDQQDKKLYTYTEFRETFFPNLKGLDDEQDFLTRESFLEFLNKANHSMGATTDSTQTAKGKKEA